MAAAYPIIKWLHILFAVAALGANMTYGIWLAAASRNPASLPFALRTIKLLDDRFANPAYGLLLVSGIALVLIGPYDFSTPWIQFSITLYVFAVLLGILGYSRTLRKQIALAEATGPATAEYSAASRRGMLLGIMLAVLVVTIEFLMTAKPRLWGRGAAPPRVE